MFGCNFLPSQNYVFIYQRDGHFLMNPKSTATVNLKLPLAQQFACFAYHILTKLEPDERTRACADLVLDQRPFNATLADISKALDVLAAKLAKLENALPALMIMGKLLESSLSFLKETLDREVYHTLYTNTVGLFHKIAQASIPERAKQTAYNGFLIISHALVLKGEAAVARYWDFLSKDNKLFTLLVDSYFNILSTWKAIIPELAYKSLETAIAESKLNVSLKLELTKRLILFAPNLVYFVEKVIAVYGKNVSMKVLENEVINLLQTYTSSIELTFEDVLNFIGLLRNNKIREPFKTVFLNNQVFLSILRQRFDPVKEISEKDVTPLLEIYSRGFPEVISLQWENIKALLQPLLSNEAIDFARLLGDIISKVGSPEKLDVITISNLLWDRLTLIFDGIPKAEVMRKLKTELDSFDHDPFLRVTNIPNKYLTLALRLLKKSLREYKELLKLCTELDSFSEPHRAMFYKFVFKGIKKEVLDRGDFEPFERIAELMQAYEGKENKGVLGIFYKMCRYFDKTKATAYDPPKLVVQFFDTLALLLKHANPETIPKTLAAIHAFYTDFLAENISLEVADFFKKMKTKETILFILDFVNKSGEAEAILKRFLEDLNEIYLTLKCFKNFAEETALLETSEREVLRKFMRSYNCNLYLKTIKEMKEGMPKELSTLVSPLKEYYSYKKIVSIRTLLAKELGAGIKLYEFPSRFEQACKSTKLKLSEFLKECENKTLLEYEELFGNCRKISDEIKRLEDVLPEDKDRMDTLCMLHAFYLEAKALLDFAKDVAELKEVIELKDLCYILDKYKKEVKVSKVTKAKQLTKELKVILNNLFGEHLEYMMARIQDLALGKDMLMYLSEKGLKYIDSLKEIVRECDDERITTYTLDMMTELYGYITHAREQKNIKEFTGYTLRFFKIRLEDSSALLREAGIYLKKLGAVREDAEGREIRQMERIKKILEQSTFDIKKEDNKWNLSISYLQEGEVMTGRFTHEKLLELQERAIHVRNIKKIERKAEKDQEKIGENKYDTFLALTGLLKDIISTLEYVSDLSYPDLKDVYFLTLQNEDLSPFKELLNQFVQIKDKWEAIIVAGYKQYGILTYLLPSHFWQLEGYFFNTLDNQQFAMDLLRFIGVKLPINIKSEYDPKSADLMDRVLYLGDYLTSICNPTPPIPLPTSTIIAYAVQETNLLESIFAIYHCFNPFVLPLANQLLFCHSGTKWEQVLSFAYRASQNPNKIFTIVHVEELSYENQKKLVQIIQNEVMERNKVPIGFIVKTMDSHVLQYFDSRNTLYKINNSVWQSKEALVKGNITKVLKREYLKEYYDNVQIYSSYNAGQGKTTFIGKVAKDKNLSLHYFSLYGEVDLLQVIQRLSKLTKKLSALKSAICFKIFPITNPEVLDELFFQILIMRSLQYEDQLVCFPNSLRVFVEIASTHNETLASSFSFKDYFFNGGLGTSTIYHINPELPIFKHVFNYLRLLCSKDGLLNTVDLSINNLQPVNYKESQDLLKKYLFADIPDYKLMTCIQFIILFKFLSKMLQNYEKSPLFASASDLKKKGITRATIVQKLLAGSKALMQNTIQSREIIDRQQNSVDDTSSNRSSVLETDDFVDMIGSRIVPFKDRKMAIISFTEKGTLLPLFDELSGMPADIEKIVTAFYALRRRDEDNPTAIFKKDRKSIKHADFVKFLKAVFENPNMDPADYVFTFDNFYKMGYIYLRAISGIPVILMGETGCGKTRMIQFLCEKILASNLTVMNIHMGVTSEDIIVEVEKMIADAKASPMKKHCIFFDEFNTNENLGLITEIMCDRMLEGVPIPENILFFAACNPYKKAYKSSANSQVAGLLKTGLISSVNRKLLYKVYQLPKTIIEYVWDFGPLRPEDEEAYIRAIIDSEKHPKELQNIMVSIIRIAHQYFRVQGCMRSNEDQPQIISLRDIKRFLSLFKWFNESGRNKGERAAILAFVFCYYYRISDENSRENLLCQVSAKLSGDGTGMKIKEIINSEANYYTSHIKLEKDIVWNNSLKESLFVMIISVLTKTPLLVVGKPGCSKTLALQILQEHFRGKNSPIAFFRGYKEVALYTLQGSLQCDSAEVVKVFERAKAAAKDPNVLSVVVIEEIGLCESSPRNPLKVLHKMLEIEKIDVGFIGLSNWALDAAKMNRALYLNRIPPTAQELEITACEIYKSFNNNQEEPIMKTLAEAYWTYQTQYSDDLLSERFGLRDYYSLIKQVAKVLPNCEQSYEKYRAIKIGIRKNFSKFPLRKESLWKVFCKKEEEAMHYVLTVPKRIELITKSIGTDVDRFILITGDYNTLPIITQLYIPINWEKISVIVGSEFEEDQDSPEYTNMVLSRIIYCVEKGKPLLLKRLKKIHSHLYDLYNQHQGSDSCRIMAGKHFHPICKLHKYFRCIILMDINDFYHEQPPFLNRLEKYHLELGRLFAKGEDRLHMELAEWLKSLIRPQASEETVTLPYLFANLDPNMDLVRILIVSRMRQKKLLFDSLKKDLIQLATADFLMQVSASKNNESKKRQIEEMYKEAHQLDLFEELALYSDEVAFARLLFFTYMDKAECLKILQARYHDKVMTVVIKNIKSEESLTNEILNFFTSKHLNLLVVAVDLTTEHKHIEHLQAIIQQYQEDGPEKNVCILLFMKHNQVPLNRPVIYLDGYTMKMKDSLEGNQEDMFRRLKELIKKFSLQEIEKNFDKNFLTLLMESFATLKSKWPGFFKALLRETKKESHELMKKFAEDEEILALFKAKIKEMLSNIPENEESLRERLCGAKAFPYQSVSHAAKHIVKEKIQHAMYVIICTIEKYSAFRSYFSLYGSYEGKTIEETWKAEFEKLPYNWEIKETEEIHKPYYYGLKYPFSLAIYEKLEKMLFREDLRMAQKLTKEELIEMVMDQEVVIGDKFPESLMLLLEDFFMITATRNHIEVKVEMVHAFLQFLLFDEASKSAVFVQLVKIVLDKQTVVKAILGLLGICSEFPVLLELLTNTVDLPVEPLEGSVKRPEFIKKVQERGGILIGKLIEQLIPSPFLLEFLTRFVLKYTELLIRVYIYSFQICESSTGDIPNWYILLFLLELSKLDSSDLLQEISDKIREMHGAYGSFIGAMQSDDFGDYCLNRINTLPDLMLLKPHNVQKFKVQLYKILLCNANTKFVPILLNEYNDEENGKFYVTLLKIVCEKAKLFDMLESYSKPRIPQRMDPFLRSIEKYLVANGVTCKFGTVLFYYIWQNAGNKKAYNKVVSGSHPETHITHYLMLANIEYTRTKCECPNILCILSCVYLRGIIESQRLKHPETEVSPKSVLSVELAGLEEKFKKTYQKQSYPLVATLLLYVQKMMHFYKKPVTVTKKHDFPLPLILEENQRETYNNLLLLTRHLKAVEFLYDDVAFYKWFESIIQNAFKGYAFLLPLSTVFLNEFYTNHLESSPKESAVNDTIDKKLMRDSNQAIRFMEALGENLAEFLTSLNKNFFGQSKLLSFTGSMEHHPLLPIAVAFTVCIFLSSKDLKNPFTTAFYGPKRSLEDVANRIKASYLFGRRDTTSKSRDKGYNYKHLPERGDRGESVREVSGLTHRVLHFILHSVLYYLNYKKLLDEVTYPEENLRNHLYADIGILKELLKLEGFGSGVWLISVLSDFAKVLPLLEPNGTAREEEDRSNFEVAFENEVILPNAKSPLEIVKRYNEKWNCHKASEYYIDPVELLTEQKFDPYYTLHEFFGLVAVPSLDHFLKVVRSEETKVQYPIAALIGMHEEGKIDRIKNLYHIIRLTNFFLDEYNYKLTRQKAQTEQIKFQKYDKLTTLIKEFIEAWGNSKFPSEFTLGKELKTDGYVLLNHAMEDKEGLIEAERMKVKNDISYNSSSYVKDFLLDPKQKPGMLLIAAIQDLAKTQNEILSSFKTQLKSMLCALDFKDHPFSYFDQEACPVQSVTMNDLIFLDKKYSKLATRYYYPARDQKAKLYYDFSWIENYLMVQLMDKRVLDYTCLDCITYQDDTGNKITVLEELRKKGCTETLLQFEAEELKSFCNDLIFNRKYEKIKEILNTLRSLMYYVCESKVIPKESLKNFCQQRFDSKSALHSFPGEYKELAGVELAKLVSLYETLELNFFDFLLQFVPDNFNNSEREYEVECDIRRFAGEIKNSEGELLNEFIIALKRFVLRYLDASFNEENLLKDYVFLKHLWNPLVHEKSFTARMVFSEKIDIKVKETLVVLRIMKDITEKARTIIGSDSNRASDIRSISSEPFPAKSESGDDESEPDMYSG